MFGKSKDKNKTKSDFSFQTKVFADSSVFGFPWKFDKNGFRTLHKAELIGYLYSSTPPLSLCDIPYIPDHKKIIAGESIQQS